MAKTDFEKFALGKGIGSHLLNDYKAAYVNPTSYRGKTNECHKY